MMRHELSRKGATTGGFATSLALHAGLFLLLMLMMRAGADTVQQAVDELTEIAYIEERYGKDVAEQVRVKTKPVVQAEEIAKAEPKPEVKPAEAQPEVKPAEPEPVPAEPALKSKPKLESLAPPKLDTRPMLQNKPMDVAAPKLSQQQQQQFRDATSRKLEGRNFADATVPNLDTRNLRNVDALAADVNAPALQSKSTGQSSFDPGTQALVGRKSKTDLSDVAFEVGSGSGGGRMAMQIATGGVEGGNANLVGGRLEEGQTAWQGSVDELVQTAQSNRARQAAEVDVAAPALQSRDDGKGRRTMMDYGAGNGGSRGSLKGGRRASGGLAEAPIAAEIAKAEEPAVEQQAQIAEATPKAMGGKGVAMTISGQIQGRKIVKSTLPVYSDAARRNGWEGVVAVHFTVMPDGRVKDNMYFEQTSPHSDLNNAARDAIKQFVFESLNAENRVEQWGVITIVFRLS